MQQPIPSAPELPPMKPVASSAPVSAPASSAAPASSRSGGFGLRRLRQMVSIVAGGGFALVVLIGGGELALREGIRPSDLLATIEARTERGVMNQKMGVEPGKLVMTEADYQRAIAQAQREGQAKAEIGFQRELAAVQADKERVVGAYQTLFQRANMIAQAALHLENVAQQFRQQLLAMSNGGRNMVIMFKDIFCGLGSPEACASARTDRGTMIAEADELSRGDVGKRVRELMAGIDDPATFITHADRRRHGTPKMSR
jgi:uncharacterized short protein YbdD (DUF466 family)